MTDDDVLRLIQSKAALAPAYTLFGNEVQLIEEARICLRRRTAADTVAQVELKDLPGSPMATMQGESLFGGHRFLEVIARGSPVQNKKSEKGDSPPPPAKNGEEEASSSRRWDTLVRLVEQAQLPNVLVLVFYDLDAKHKKRQKNKTQWHRYLCDRTVAVYGETLKPSQTTQWINFWLRECNLRADDDALRILLAQSENNLTVCKQAILRLALTTDPESAIDDALMTRALSYGARYTVFDLADAVVAGEGRRALRILGRLRDIRTADELILWSLADVAGKILSLQQGISPPNVWGERLTLLRELAQKCDQSALAAVLRKAAYADKINKGIVRDNIAVLLAQLVVDLAVLRRGVKIALPGFYS